MLDKTTVKILKFIAKNQPCAFEDVEKFIGVEYRDSPHFVSINQNHLICKVGSLPDGRPLIALTPNAELAIEKYQQKSFSRVISIITVIISVLILCNQCGLNLIERMIQLVRALLG